MCPCGRNNGSSSGSAAIKLIDINLIVSLDFSGTRQVTFYTSVSSFSAKRDGNLLGVYRLMMMKGLQVKKNGKPVSQIFMNFFIYLVAYVPIYQSCSYSFSPPNHFR